MSPESSVEISLAEAMLIPTICPDVLAAMSVFTVTTFEPFAGTVTIPPETANVAVPSEKEALSVMRVEPSYK